MVQRMRSIFNPRVGLVFASMTDCCHGHSCNCAEYLQQVSSHRICFPTAIGRAPSIVEWILAYKSVQIHSCASTRTDALHLLAQNSAILLSIDHLWFLVVCVESCINEASNWILSCPNHHDNHDHHIIYVVFSY